MVARFGPVRTVRAGGALATAGGLLIVAARHPAMALAGFGLVVTAFTAVVACINNTGPGLGGVGPSGTFQDLSDFQTWVCSITMLLGRLELLSVLVLFTPGFWRR